MVPTAADIITAELTGRPSPIPELKEQNISYYGVKEAVFIKAKVPYMTTIAAAKATDEGIGYVKSHGTGEVKSLQQLHSEITDL